MKRLLATLIFPAAILLTSCGSGDPGVDSPPALSVTDTAPPAPTTVLDTTDPAFTGGCSAMSVYIQQQVQRGDASPETAGTEFLKIVESDPSYLAMPAHEKELFRQGIEASVAGAC
ncbi:hypothetical protein [Rhodococcus sp. 27YEA15]|uniref:hypothetical protein n=1 Tax=Rhodococcus sp. 27YEA15 TaxID=3156259 RepID=UPI003C79E303